MHHSGRKTNRKSVMRYLGGGDDCWLDKLKWWFRFSESDCLQYIQKQSASRAFHSKVSRENSRNEALRAVSLDVSPSRTSSLIIFASFTYHQDMPVDRRELQSSWKKSWSSNEAAMLLMLPNVCDERRGENTDIAEIVGKVPVLIPESCEENSEKTK